MKKILLKIQRFFGFGKKPTISEFFFNASPKEQEKLLRKVARKASQDQQALLDKFDRLYPDGLKKT